MHNDNKACCEVMKDCPCHPMMKKNRAKVLMALAGAGLVFLLLQAGWILGVIAFFRTV